MIKTVAFMRYACLISLICLLVASCKDAGKEAKPAAVSTDPKIAALKLPEDFHAEHLYSPGMDNRGSWVAMTFDDKGRMITSDQYGDLYRLTIPAIGADTSREKVKVEPMSLKIPGDTSWRARRIGYAHGLLYAFNSLYVMVNDEGDTAHSRPSGIYRLEDTDKDDQYDKITMLKRLEGEGEHGPHSMVVSPDGKQIYFIAGNFTRMPKFDKYAPLPGWEMDNLLPLLRDPNGHDNTVNTHGGWIAKMDPDGSNATLIANGFRNPFDLAFNEDGEMFTFDSDMEWDFGLPWYRPIRICHVTSGAEFGWRPGTDKWSPTNADNLPALVNIGQGSPTGVFSGINAHFPERYRRSIFAFDWSFGIIYAVQPTAKGAGYTGKAEEFISGSPLPLTDGTIGPDGALYFLSGGRRIESDLYRVYYKDNKQGTEALSHGDIPAEMKLRRQLEAWHLDSTKADLNVIWSNLKHEDRFIRFAARVALEHQPSSTWEAKMLAEKDPVTLSAAALAYARRGDKEKRDAVVTALSAVDLKSLSADQQLDLLRSIEVVILRMGVPGDAAKKALIATLDPNYPAANNTLNRSFSKILLAIEAPGAVEKTMKLMADAKDDPEDEKTFTNSSDLILRNPQYGLDIAAMLANVPPRQQTFYATALSQSKNGWTPELRNTYFQWFYKAFGYKGGHSFSGFIDLARKKALSNVPKAEFALYNKVSGDSLLKNANLFMGEMGNMRRPKGPGKDWELDTALAYVKDGLGTGRDYENGKAMFAASLCISCHTMRGEGGSAGPDLTNVGTRFSLNDMVTAIVEPSKTISDQYGSTVFYLKEGGSVLGRLVSQDGDKYVISQNPFAPQQHRELAKKDVLRTRASEISPMLPGLVNSLNPEELKDLLAYLKSGGNVKDSVFATHKP
jgi:putative heme-binding domain-containing protein